MKLPIVLSAMIAALAIPGSLASENNPADAGAAPAADAGAAPAADAAAAPAEAPKKHHGKRKRKHTHHAGAASTNQPSDPYKKSFDQNNYELPKADGDASVDNSPKAGPMEQPGQKMP